MVPFFTVFIFSVVVGAAFIVIAYVVSPRAAKSEKLDVDTSLIEERLAKSLENVDIALEQLNSMSGLIFEELESKYKELLFLYQLIDEKKIEVSKIYQNNIELVNSFNQSNSFINSDDVGFVKESLSIDLPQDSFFIEKGIGNHPRLPEIISLYNDGKSVADIAKELSIGQGEVKLIIELNKQYQKNN